VAGFVVVIVAVVMQSYAVELLKGVGKFAHWGSETRVKRDTFDLGGSDIHTVALLHVAEVRCFNTCALVRNDRGLHVA
jgi:hypothetical protein